MRDTPTDNGEHAEARTGPYGPAASLEAGGKPTEVLDTDAFEDEPTILLLMAEGRNRQLLAEALDSVATVVGATSVDDSEAFDLCIVSHAYLPRVHESLRARVSSAEPSFLPIALLVDEDTRLAPELFSLVDEVFETPVSKATLYVRLANLLERRRQSQTLVERDAELDAMVARLQVRDRALAEAPIGISISGPREADAPLLYVNDAFTDLTGYDREDAIGRNCRFLQGDRTDDVTVAQLRRAIERAEPISVDIVNYTKDGERFWNKLDVAPVRNQVGEVTHFVGFQTDITARKLHEQRLQVLNRLMRHDLRNQLNVIEGYADALTSGSVDEDLAIDRIQRAVDRLVKLSGETTHVEHVFDSADAIRFRRVTEIVDEIEAELAERYPEIPVHVDGTDIDESVYIKSRTLALSCVDYLSMLLDASERADPEVYISASYDRANDAVSIALSDNDGGIDTADWDVIEAGVETPLNHADRLGLWMLQWATTRTGGEIVPSDHNDGELVLRIPVQRRESSDDTPTESE